MGLFDNFSRDAKPNPDEISYADLVTALDGGKIALIDVREPAEFTSGHVQGAVSMPLSRFDATKLPQGAPVVLMCKAGGRSAQALAKARAAGRNDVRHYPGGANGWAQNGGKFV